MMSEAEWPGFLKQGDDLSSRLGRFVISPVGAQELLAQYHERMTSFGYHGTTIYAAEQIIREGFQASSAHGQAYFATDPLPTFSYAQTRTLDQPFAVLNCTFAPQPGGHMTITVPNEQIKSIRVVSVTAYNPDQTHTVNKPETERLMRILDETRKESR